jgi:hypothetical protein
VPVFTGAAPAVSSAAARGHGDEGRHHISGRRTVSQDLHPEARECEVSPSVSFLYTRCDLNNETACQAHDLDIPSLAIQTTICYVDVVWSNICLFFINVNFSPHASSEKVSNE